MNDSKVTVIGVLFLILCLGLVGGIWYLDGQLRELRGQRDRSEQERVDFERDRSNLQAQIRVFNESFEILGRHNVRAAQNELEFQNQVQHVIDPHIRDGNIAMISMRQGPVTAGRATLIMTLRGDYYTFMNILAAWRNVGVTVRVSALSMMASRTPQVRGEIQTDVTLEAIIAAN